MTNSLHLVYLGARKPQGSPGILLVLQETSTSPAGRGSQSVLMGMPTSGRVAQLLALHADHSHSQASVPAASRSLSYSPALCMVAWNEFLPE